MELEYQPIVRTNRGPYRATALVGTYSIIIARDADARERLGLRGFSLRRTARDPATGEIQRLDWLSGQKRFRGRNADVGLDIRSDQGSFQRFRWSDYSVTHECQYDYEIYPMRGPLGRLERGEGLKLSVRPSPYKVDGLGVYFNRGVTAAPAYLRRFGNQRPGDDPGGNTLRWLSRELKESLLDFIDRAQSGQGLRVAIYEFHVEEVARALATARSRGVDVKIVYHQVDPAKKTDRESRHVLEANGLDSADIASARTRTRISHNKFVVLVQRGVRQRAVQA